MKSLLDQLTTTASAMEKAIALQALVATVGFDWPTLTEVFAKLHEEINELQVEITAKADKQRIVDEFGDILFVCANIGRWLAVDPETALKHANQKFEQRFRLMETQLQQKHANLSACSFMEMLEAWESVKKQLKNT